MSAKSTPGPWEVDWTLRSGRDGGQHGYFEITANRGMFWIAKTLAFSTGENIEQYNANARLIAASPRMYHILCALRDRNPGDDGPYVAACELLKELEGRNA